MEAALNYFNDKSMGYDSAFSLRNLVQPISNQATSPSSAFAVSEKPVVGFAEVPPKTIVVRVEKTVPFWLRNATPKIQELMQLGENWDTYGAKPIKLDAIVAGINLLSEVMSNSIPSPSVVPVPSGAIQLEWHRDGQHVEIEINSPTEARLFFVDDENEQEIEDDGPFPKVITHLQELLTHLYR